MIGTSNIFLAESSPLTLPLNNCKNKCTHIFSALLEKLLCVQEQT